MTLLEKIKLKKDNINRTEELRDKVTKNRYIILYFQVIKNDIIDIKTK